MSPDLTLARIFHEHFVRQPSKACICSMCEHVYCRALTDKMFTLADEKSGLYETRLAGVLSHALVNFL